MVPAKGHNSVNLTFTPFPNEDVPHDIECLSFARGYLSIEDRVASVEGKVTRKQAYDVPSIRINMTGVVRPAT